MDKLDIIRELLLERFSEKKSAKVKHGSYKLLLDYASEKGVNIKSASLLIEYLAKDLNIPKENISIYVMRKTLRKSKLNDKHKGKDILTKEPKVKVDKPKENDNENDNNNESNDNFNLNIQ